MVEGGALGMERDINFPLPLDKDSAKSFVGKFAESISLLLNFISTVDILESLSVLDIELEIPGGAETGVLSPSSGVLKAHSDRTGGIIGASGSSLGRCISPEGSKHSRFPMGDFS